MNINYSELSNVQLKDINDVFKNCIKIGFFKQNEIFVELEKLNYLGESYIKHIEYYKEKKDDVYNIYHSVVMEQAKLYFHLGERFLKTI